MEKKHTFLTTIRLKTPPPTEKFFWLKKRYTAMEKMAEKLKKTEKIAFFRGNLHIYRCFTSAFFSVKNA